MLQNQSLRIVFFGSSSFAASHLLALTQFSTHQIIAVFTQSTFANLTKKQQDISSFPSIIAITKKYNLPLFQSKILSTLDIIHIIKKLKIDLIVVVSYGLILTKEILNIPKLGCINVHGSLLPRWRGPAPIQRAIENGDSITGISIIKMDTGIDTGNILCAIQCNIVPNDTSYSLTNKLAKIGSNALLKTIQKIALGETIQDIPQDKIYAKYAKKINKQKEARINWNTSALQLERRIRAFNPWPISYFQIKNHRIRVWSASINEHYKKIHNISSSVSPGTILKITPNGIYINTKTTVLMLTAIQIEGKKITTILDFLNAYQNWFTLNSILE